MNWLPVNELSEKMVGKMATVGVGIPDYLITHVAPFSVQPKVVTFKNHIEEIKLTSGYVGVHNHLGALSFVRNLESGVIHAVGGNGKNICGVRHSQNSETTSTDYATCEKCIELINK